MAENEKMNPGEDSLEIILETDDGPIVLEEKLSEMTPNQLITFYDSSPIARELLDKKLEEAARAMVDEDLEDYDKFDDSSEQEKP